MIDELNQPLGQNRQKPRNGVRAGFGGGALGLLALIAAVYALSMAPRDPYAGQPHAVARIEPAKPAEPPPPAASQSAAVGAAEDEAQRAKAAREVSNANDVEQMAGVKITRVGGPDASGPLIIKIDPPAGIGLPPAPDKRLVEQGRYGPLPKIGADGARPMDVYARPLATSLKLKADAPRLALVVGGLGLNPSVTTRAIDQLPEGVTLAFAPYGQSVEQLAAHARERGHETLLQAPMEPFDYPQNNPGPHTLLTRAPSGVQLEDLHWLLSRFAGYAGVMNFLGARFTADEKALNPALAELAARGLFYLDDGTSPQSLAAMTASRLSLPFARVDVVVDAKESPAAIDAALVELEALARRRGAAIGYVSAFPDVVARVTKFARELERRGVALAPVTATLERSSLTNEMRTTTTQK
jgi:polysaccharide deacetylase 2 family uncharacterized protein YibQ